MLWLLTLPRAAGSDEGAAHYFWTWLSTGLLLMAGLTVLHLLRQPSLLAAGLYLGLILWAGVLFSVLRGLWRRQMNTDARKEYVMNLWNARRTTTPLMLVSLSAGLLWTVQSGNPLNLLACAAAVSGVAALYLDALRTPSGSLASGREHGAGESASTVAVSGDPYDPATHHHD